MQLNVVTGLNSQNAENFLVVMSICQNMFYISGEVISDKSNHLILIRNLQNSAKTRTFWEFFPMRGGGSHLFPEVCICQNSDQKVIFFVKTKNGPILQNKPYFFILKTGVPKRGGGPTFGTNSQKIPFFFMSPLLNHLITDNSARLPDPL